MAGVVCPEVRNLALHPDIAVLTFQMRAYCSDQSSHYPDAALWCSESESELVGRGHCEEFTGENQGQPRRSAGWSCVRTISANSLALSSRTRTLKAGGR